MAVDGCRPKLEDLSMRLISLKGPRYFRNDVKNWKTVKTRWFEENKGFLSILEEMLGLCVAHARVVYALVALSLYSTLGYVHWKRK